MHRTGPAVWFLSVGRGSVPARPVIGPTLSGEATRPTMRYRDRKPPNTKAEFAEVGRRWRSLGWEEVPEAEMPDITAAVESRFDPQRKGDLRIPRPARAWLLPWRQALPEEIEAEFTLKLLSAFRRCIRLGERLLVIDPQHQWYRLDPHGGITAATRDEWAMPMLPDGDTYIYLAPDFRLGVISRWHPTGPVTLFGQNLLDAFAEDPPTRFLEVCGPGRTGRRITRRCSGPEPRI